MASSRKSKVTIAGEYVIVDGVKVCRVSEGVVLIYDRNKARSNRKGGAQIEVSVFEFVRAVRLDRS